jgi:hypothetical protein
MELTLIQRWVMPLTSLVVWTGTMWGYLSGPTVSLEDLTAQADIIFKGTAVSTSAVQDEWFKPYAGFIVCGTEFKVISVIKGENSGGQLIFRHYDDESTVRSMDPYPQYYHFETGRTYLVFAKTGGSPSVFRQLWTSLKTKEDQGVLLCADDNLVSTKTVKDLLWSELMTMLTSPSVSDVLYAIDQLDKMSSGDTNSSLDFERGEVAQAVYGLMRSRHAKIAQAAIGLVGSHNPYMSNEQTFSWLAIVGNVEAPCIVKMDSKMKTPSGELCWRDFVLLADSQIPEETRALAIRALGLAQDPLLEEAIERWLADPAPEIRASAVLLLADFPGPETWIHLTALAADTSPKVRACVARACGLMQKVEMADILAKLLVDEDYEVHEAAAMSLLSFPPQDKAIGRVFRANIENEEFKPLFLIALARENPAPYLDGLARVVVEKMGPKIYWGGEIPAFTAWKILFNYLQSQPYEEVRSGKFAPYLDAMEKVANYSSSVPRDIYAFYVQRGMTGRAKKFRKEVNKSASHDIDYYFKQVDENPLLYMRE